MAGRPRRVLPQPEVRQKLCYHSRSELYFIQLGRDLAFERLAIDNLSTIDNHQGAGHGFVLLLPIPVEGGNPRTEAPPLPLCGEPLEPCPDAWSPPGVAAQGQGSAQRGAFICIMMRCAREAARLRGRGAFLRRLDLFRRAAGRFARPCGLRCGRCRTDVDQGARRGRGRGTLPAATAT